jgi:hypothetical protein
LFVQETGDVDIVAAGQDLDDLVVLDVADRRRVVTLVLCPEADEARLVEPDRARAVEALAVCREQGAAIGGHGVIDGVPVTVELVRHLFDRPAGAHLHRCPLRGPGREQALLGGDAVVGEHPALFRAAVLDTDHPVLLPAKPHRRAIDGQVDVADDRALFDLGEATAARTSHLIGDLLDHQLDVRAATSIVKDADVFQADERLEDLTRVSDDEGASCLLAHTSSLKCLRRLLGDPPAHSSPLRSEEPYFIGVCQPRQTAMFEPLRVGCIPLDLSEDGARARK